MPVSSPLAPPPFEAVAWTTELALLQVASAPASLTALALAVQAALAVALAPAFSTALAFAIALSARASACTPLLLVAVPLAVALVPSASAVLPLLLFAVDFEMLPLPLVVEVDPLALLAVDFAVPPPDAVESASLPPVALELALPVSVTFASHPFFDVLWLSSPEVEAQCSAIALVWVSITARAETNAMLIGFAILTFITNLLPIRTVSSPHGSVGVEFGVARIRWSPEVDFRRG